MTQIRRFQPDLRRIVEIVAFPGVQLLDISGPLQVFASANDFARARGLGDPYEPFITAATSPIHTSAQLELLARPLSSDFALIDTLIVPGGAGVDAAMADADLIAWLQSRAGRARRTASVCTGAFLLAQAGLLHGRSAATHWARASELAERFPTVKVLSKPIFVQDGSVWSSAGVTAGIDLCLALVEQDLGLEIALEIARDLVIFFKRPGDQAQFSTALSLQGASGFERLHGWILDNLTSDLSLQSLAERCGMSERTFCRRYADTVGMTPARAVERLRVEAACRILSETQEPLKIVASRCGFKSEDVFRRCFKRLLSVSPSEYRDTWKVQLL